MPKNSDSFHLVSAVAFINSSPLVLFSMQAYCCYFVISRKNIKQTNISQNDDIKRFIKGKVVTSYSMSSDIVLVNILSY